MTSRQGVECVSQLCKTFDFASAVYMFCECGVLDHIRTQK